jgi:hypothetical protein
MLITSYVLRLRLPVQLGLEAIDLSPHVTEAFETNSSLSSFRLGIESNFFNLLSYFRRSITSL